MLRLYNILMQMLFRVEVEVRLEEEISLSSWWVYGVGHAIAKKRRRVPSTGPSVAVGFPRPTRWSIIT